MSLELNCSEQDIYILPYNEYPQDWMKDENIKCREIGTLLMQEKKYLAIKVKSKINPYEYNYLLNPLSPGYHDMVKVAAVEELPTGIRLINCI